MRRILAGNVYRRLPVIGIAPFGQFGEYLQGIASAQQGAGVASLDAFGQHGGFGIEPDRQRRTQDQPPGIVIDKSTAAGCDHFAPSVDQPRDDTAFAVTEMRFAEAIENIGHAHPGGEFDFVIGIDEGQVQAAGKAAPDGGLADAHQAHQHDRPGRWRRLRGGLGLQHDRRGYTAAIDFGQKPVSGTGRNPQTPTDSLRFGFAMSRPLVLLIVIIALIVGALFFLSGRDATREPVTVEKVVPLENLAN